MTIQQLEMIETVALGLWELRAVKPDKDVLVHTIKCIMNFISKIEFATYMELKFHTDDELDRDLKHVIMEMQHWMDEIKIKELKRVAINKGEF